MLQPPKELGVRPAIDDMGTGYSSLWRLRKLSVDGLKVGQQFVRSTLLSESSVQIVGAVLDHAANFSLKTVAEGVEDDALADADDRLHFVCELRQSSEGHDAPS